MAEKQYYWIKLKTDFFNRNEIDFLLSQNNGCEYIVLYQMLCLNTANNNGELVSRIGEMIVPYNPEKISRDTKYFDVDTIIVALELYKKLGLVYEGDNRVLKITKFEQMVGSETKWAEYKRKRRLENVQPNSNKRIEYRDKTIEYRDKTIEYRDKTIEIDIDKEIETDTTTISSKNEFLQFIEKSLGRKINQIELEMIQKWEDNEITRYAIKEAILKAKKNIKYINAIIIKLTEKGITTIEDAEREEEKFHKYKESGRMTSYERQMALLE